MTCQTRWRARWSRGRGWREPGGRREAPAPRPRPRPAPRTRKCRRRSNGGVSRPRIGSASSRPSEDQQARFALAHMMEFHRREDKATWWEAVTTPGETAALCQRGPNSMTSAGLGYGAPARADSRPQRRERRAQARHPAYAAPELVATGPKQVWSWDITKLKGPVPYLDYSLYVTSTCSTSWAGWSRATRMRTWPSPAGGDCAKRASRTNSPFTSDDRRAALLGPGYHRQLTESEWGRSKRSISPGTPAA